MVKGSDDNLRPDDLRESDDLRRSSGYATASDGNRDRDRDRDRERDRNERSRRSSDAIKEDIERTRAELDRTVDALQERLAPETLVQSAFDTLRANAGDMVRSAACAIRANPIPAALIGIGVVWLLSSSARRTSDYGAQIEYYEYDQYEGFEQPTQPAI